MSPKERLVRYFELSRRQSKLNAEEYREMIHLEEALIDDMDDFEKLLGGKHE